MLVDPPLDDVGQIIRRPDDFAHGFHRLTARLGQCPLDNPVGPAVVWDVACEVVAIREAKDLHACNFSSPRRDVQPTSQNVPSLGA
jgi:hypothetical protein